MTPDLERAADPVLREVMKLLREACEATMSDYAYSRLLRAIALLEGKRF